MNCHILKLIVIGDSNVGKTSLMNKYVSDVFTHDTKSTVGVDFTLKEVVVDDTHITLQIWDTVGQERFHSVCTAYYRGCDGCVLVYDVTNSKSFERLNYWYNEFLINAAPKDKENFPFVLVGNKVDISSRQVSTIEAEEWCISKYQCPYYETSAIDGINVDFVFERVAEMVVRRATQEKTFRE